MRYIVRLRRIDCIIIDPDFHPLIAVFDNSGSGRQMVYCCTRSSVRCVILEKKKKYHNMQPITDYPASSQKHTRQTAKTTHGTAGASLGTARASGSKERQTQGRERLVRGEGGGVVALSEPERCEKFYATHTAAAAASAPGRTIMWGVPMAEVYIYTRSGRIWGTVCLPLGVDSRSSPLAVSRMIRRPWEGQAAEAAF